MTEVNNLETIYSALKALSLLRANVSDVFKHLLNSSQAVNGNQDSSESANDEHIKQLTQLIGNLTTRFRELEATCTLLSPMNPSIQLGNTQLVGLDPNYDKTSLYPDMVISYRWLDNLQEYSSVACQAMQSMVTKRHGMSRNRQNRALKAPKMTNNYNIPNYNIDCFISTLQRTFEMSFDVVRPFGVFTVLKIVLDRTLKAAIVLRGFVIEWVLIKAFDETFETNNLGSVARYEKRLRPTYMHGGDMHDDDKIDIWTPSRHKLFRIITDHANAAILHFYAPLQMESAIKAYLLWLRSYSTLFTAKCRKCDCRLLNSMPPTWRDFRANNDPYHFECRPCSMM